MVVSSHQLKSDSHGKSHNLKNQFLPSEIIRCCSGSKGCHPLQSSGGSFQSNKFHQYHKLIKTPKIFMLVKRLLPNASHSDQLTIHSYLNLLHPKMIQNHKTVLTICACWKTKKLFHCSPAIHTKLPNKYSTFCIHHTYAILLNMILLNIRYSCLEEK